MTVWPVLLASLVGSPHCAAMCGLIAGAANRSRGAAAAYHSARFLGYLALGTLAGALGGAADWLGATAGAVGTATRIAGLLLVVAGTIGMLRALGVRRSGAPPQHRWIARIAAKGRSLSPPARAGLLGIVTALLPCGWLYAFIAVAGGTGRPATGALVMAAFWAGTVPAVVGAGMVIARLSGPIRARLPVLSAAILIVFGLLTAFARPANHHQATPDIAVHAHARD